MSSEGSVPPGHASRSLLVFVCLTAVLAVAGVVVTWRCVGTPSDLLALGVLTGLGLLSQTLRERDVGQRITLSFLSIIQLAAIPAVGPLGAAVVGGLAHGLDPHPLPAINRVFNTAMVTILGWVGGAVYILCKGEQVLDAQGLDGLSPGGLLLHVALPLLVADIVQMLVNAIFIAGVLRVERGSPLRVTFFGMVSTSGWSYLGYGAIGFLFVVLWFPAGVGPFSAVLILAPLFVARWAIVQYGDEVRSHESALSALVTAVETKDPHSRGHSRRTAALVEWLVDPLALSSQQATALRFATMLHDVGRVALPSRLIRTSADLGAEDLLVLAAHSEQGVDLLRGVTFLEDSLDGIRHHHERWDGRGYPDGLVGEAIPLISRVIAVADGFDSLTQPRPGREALTAAAALAEIGEGAGTHFDPRVVEALVRALERHPWEPGPDEDPDPGEAAGYFDHDHPYASVLFAEVVADAGPPATADAKRPAWGHR